MKFQKQDAQGHDDHRAHQRRLSFEHEHGQRSQCFSPGSSQNTTSEDRYSTWRDDQPDGTGNGETDVIPTPIMAHLTSSRGDSAPNLPTIGAMLTQLIGEKTEDDSGVLPVRDVHASTLQHAPLLTK